MLYKRKLIYALFLTNMIVKNEKKENIKKQKVQEKDISLERIVTSDEKRFLQISNNPLVKVNHMSNVLSKEEGLKLYKYNFKNFLRKEKPYLMLCKIILNGKEIVGFIHFWEDISISNTVFIAYSIDPKYWNLGIATIAVSLFLKLRMSTLKEYNIKRILGSVKVNNIGSKKVLEKNNFKVIDKKLFYDSLSYILEYEIK